ncbi:hypothetical protein BGX31_002536 [Mortierella sp. GBA43]|nr:hypothetical protein BGX31_002536 [Mortierella sp. GBA43]
MSSPQNQSSVQPPPQFIFSSPAADVQASPPKPRRQAISKNTKLALLVAASMEITTQPMDPYQTSPKVQTSMIIQPSTLARQSSFIDDDHLAHNPRQAIPLEYMPTHYKPPNYATVLQPSTQCQDSSSSHQGDTQYWSEDACSHILSWFKVRGNCAKFFSDHGRREAGSKAAAYRAISASIGKAENSDKFIKSAEAVGSKIKGMIQKYTLAFQKFDPNTPLDRQPDVTEKFSQFDGYYGLWKDLPIPRVVPSKKRTRANDDVYQNLVDISSEMQSHHDKLSKLYGRQAQLYKRLKLADSDTQSSSSPYQTAEEENVDSDFPASTASVSSPSARSPTPECASSMVQITSPVPQILFTDLPVAESPQPGASPSIILKRGNC